MGQRVSPKQVMRYIKVSIRIPGERARSAAILATRLVVQDSKRRWRRQRGRVRGAKGGLPDLPAPRMTNTFYTQPDGKQSLISQAAQG